MGYYVENAFTVTPELTLSLGLHWEFSGRPKYDDRLEYNCNPTNGIVIVPQAVLSFADLQAKHFGNSGMNIPQVPHISDMTLWKRLLVLKKRLRVNFEGLFAGVFSTPQFAFPYSNISVPTQVSQLYAPLGGLNVGGGMVGAGQGQAIELRQQFGF